jgi:uncharacterized protein (DUF2236 family)
VREVFGISWGAQQEHAFRALARAHRAGHHLMPHAVRRGRNDRFFDVVATGERLRGGTPTPELGVGVS